MWKPSDDSHSLMKRMEDASGYPNMDFEHWYQQGINCWDANLPKWLRKFAFNKAKSEWEGRDKTIEMWHLRAFVYGSKGLQVGYSYRGFRIPRSYEWPEPPDPSWELCVCVYENGEIDLDLLHTVSRRFMSEDCGFFKNPDYQYTSWWYEQMGFPMMNLIPIGSLKLRIGAPEQVLRLV